MDLVSYDRAVSRSWVVVALAGAAALGGCASDNGSTDAASQPSVTVAPEDAPFCDAFGALLVGPLSDAGTDATDPGVLSSAVQLTEDLLRLLVDAAPAEVADSASALAEQYGATFDVLERYGYDLARVESEASQEELAVIDTFGQAPVGPAAQDPFGRLEDYVADQCAPGVTVPADLLATSTSSTTSP